MELSLGVSPLWSQTDEHICSSLEPSGDWRNIDLSRVCGGVGVCAVVLSLANVFSEVRVCVVSVCVCWRIVMCVCVCVYVCVTVWVE